MNSTIRAYPIPQWVGHGLLLGMVAGLFGLLTPPAWGEGTQAFYCNGQDAVDTFVVPAGVTALVANLQGAHGSYPDKGAAGGFGGVAQALLPVSPGQTLYVWVGCLAQDNLAWGFGNGGSKGFGSELGGDGGFGGGGSAVSVNATIDLPPLLVAGGGGGGGGCGIGGCGPGGLPGGQGGNGGLLPEAGQPGGGGGSGGLPYDGDDRNGGNGTGAGTSTGSGGGGGGGGGFTGGGGGHGGGFGGGGGGGGASGESYADSSATDVIFATSQLAQNGLVVLVWLAGTVTDADADGVPDAVDQCAPSDLSDRVGLAACEVELPNALEVDGCTVADRVTALAAEATTHGQFVSGVARLTQQLRRQGLITANERQAFLRCAVQTEIP